MLKYLKLLSSFSALALLVFVSSCKDDEEPPKAKISFAEESITVNEADGTIEIEIVLDRPAEEDFTIEYELDGTAQDLATATNASPPDYEVLEDLNDYGEVEIEKGETSGIIEIDLWSDIYFEQDETIEIAITDIDGSEKVELVGDEMEVTIEQEDGLRAELSWNYTDVDMDLFFWAEDDGGDLVLVFPIKSVAIGFSGGEELFLPTVLGDGSYGFSCNYYEGTADPMNFELKYTEYINQSAVATVTKNGSYTLDNINVWTEADTSPYGLQVVATFDKAGTDFTNFSSISTPTSGSRVGAPTVRHGVKKTAPVDYQKIKAFMNK